MQNVERFDLAKMTFSMSELNKTSKIIMEEEVTKEGVKYKSYSEYELKARNPIKRLAFWSLIENWFI